MENDKEKWIEGVFDSMKGSKRAKPDPGLYAKIESQIFAQEVKVIPMRQWKMAAAAAVLLLVLNVFALRQYIQSSEVSTNEMVADATTDQQLISNFKLYD